MSDKQRRRLEVSELDVVRWACYVGFFVSAVGLLVTLAVGGRWLAMVVGVIVFGVPALKMYTLEQEGRRSGQVQAAWRASREQSDDWGQDMADDNDDPTVPPTPRR